jgi:hypothetical protein
VTRARFGGAKECSSDEMCAHLRHRDMLHIILLMLSAKKYRFVTFCAEKGGQRRRDIKIHICRASVI